MKPTLKQRLLKGETVQLENEENSAAVWYQSKTTSFVLELNGKVIKATKTWPPIAAKLNNLPCMDEI